MRRKNVVCGSYPRQLPAPEPILIRFEDLFPHGIAAAISGPRLEDCPLSAAPAIASLDAPSTSMKLSVAECNGWGHRYRSSSRRFEANRRRDLHPPLPSGMNGRLDVHPNTERGMQSDIIAQYYY